MAVWKEFNPPALKSMKDDFADISSPFCDKIIDYLDSGDIILASPSGVTDIFSEKQISHTNCILTDGEYSWSNSLSYYVKEYNLQLPEEFENKIIKIIRKDKK